MWGYEGFLEAIRDSKNEEHESTLEWIGGKFDSEAFDLEAVNERLRLRMMRDWNGGLEAEVGMEPAQETVFDPSRLTSLFTEISEKAAQALPLRQDAVTLLTYIRDNKVTGTQSTGNLPLKVVADVAAHFVAPPALETQIGETVFRFRTEEEVWPVFFAHVLLQGAGLINGGPGRRWRLAQSGEKFLMAPPVVQSWILFTTWWRQINWLIAYPIGAFGDNLPQEFSQSVLEALKELSIDQPTPIEALAERVLKAVAWIWPHQTPETIHSIVYSGVEQMVVDPLEEMGVLTTKRTKDATRLLDIRKLETFSLTCFGRALLDSI